MIDPNKVTAAVSEFLQNPGWNDIFTNAPGGAMERLAISFYFSKNHDDFQPADFEEYRNLREEIEKSLDEEDLNYLIENTEKPEAKKHYEDLRQRLQESGGIPRGQIRFDELEIKQGEPEQEQKESNETEDAPEERTSTEEETETREILPKSVSERDEGSESKEEEKLSDSGEKDEERKESEEIVEGNEEEFKREEVEGEESENNEEESDTNPYETALSVALEYLQKEEAQGATPRNRFSKDFALKKSKSSDGQ